MSRKNLIKNIEKGFKILEKESVSKLFISVAERIRIGDGEQIEIKNRDGTKNTSKQWNEKTYIARFVIEALLAEYHEDVIKRKSRVDEKDYSFVSDVFLLNFYMSWRLTKGVYFFDETIEQKIDETSLAVEIPFDAFLNFPEFAIYVKQESHFNEIFIKGFFAKIDTTNNDFILDLWFDTGADFDSFIPVSIPLKHNGFSLKEKLVNHGIDGDTPIVKNNTLLSQVVFNSAFNFINSFRNELGISEKTVEEICLFSVLSAVSKILYLCSEKAEYSSGSKSLSKSKEKTKKYSHFFPPENPKIIEIGMSIGKKIRQFENDIERKHIESGATKRPHIRRGHWHGVWTGAKNTETPQKFKHNWIPPLGVNIEGDI